MTTTTLPVAITCPSWCTVAEETHLAELDDIESCIHVGNGAEVPDTTHGPGRNPIEGNHPAPPVSIYMTSDTRLDGREKASPCVWMNGQGCSAKQALALADAIRELVDGYRAAGGLA